MTTGSIPPDDERTAFVKGLRQLADVLEANPESVPLPYEGVGVGLNFMFLSGDDPRADMAAAARAIPCSWQKSASHDGTSFYLNGHLHGLALTLIAEREAVCERVVTGTREVTEKVKDPEKLAEVPEIEVTKVVEDVEWRCSPVLVPAAQPESPVLA